MRDDKFTYLITWVTHNSRVSERMIKYKVSIQDPLLLDSNDEEKITEEICKVVLKDEIEVLAYNICCDHVHIIITCLEYERISIIQKLKSISSRQYNQWIKGHTSPTLPVTPLITRGHDPLLSTEKHIRSHETYAPLRITHLWAQKFHWKELADESAIEDAIYYVKNNREHHDLPRHPKRTMKFIRKMLTQC